MVRNSILKCYEAVEIQQYLYNDIAMRNFCKYIEVTSLHKSQRNEFDLNKGGFI